MDTAAFYAILQTSPIVHKAGASIEIRPLMALVINQGRCSHLPHSPRMAHELPGFVLVRARRVAHERLPPTRACLFADTRPLRARLL